MLRFLMSSSGKISSTMSEEMKKTDDDRFAELPADEQASTSSHAENAASAESEVSKLRQQFQSKEREAKDNYERFLRQTAELENFKKRAIREKEDAVRFGNESLIKDLLPVIDNLERAVMHAKGGGNGQPLVEGVELVLKGLFDVLSKHGVSQIAAAGQPFDPGKHEAMSQVETEAHEPNTVIDEFHKGYLLNDRLLRPALVSVATSSKTQGKKNGGTKVENGPTDD
jgi:molecular chaperone GrpE